MCVCVCVCVCVFCMLYLIYACIEISVNYFTASKSPTHQSATSHRPRWSGVPTATKYSIDEQSSANELRQSTATAPVLNETARLPCTQVSVRWRKRAVQSFYQHSHINLHPHILSLSHTLPHTE